MAEKKEKQYVSDNAHLMTEWNWEKNSELGFDPNRMAYQSNKIAWWKCSKGHEWKSSAAGRNRGHGCPYCSGRYAIRGETDLQTVNPALAEEWNYDKNNGLTPEDVLPNSYKKAWWKCNQGHEWQASIANRNKGNGCPYCAGQKVLEGYNDLQTGNPALASEWNYDKNVALKPAHFTANSGKRVWWKCVKGHEWQATIYHRSKGDGCPVCNSERHTSFPEYALVYYLRRCDLDVIHTYNEQGYELDIYIPSLKIAIEYDGYYWHKNSGKKDLEKNRRCQSDGITLYRIREGLLPLNDSSIDYVIERNQKDLPKVIETVISNITGTGIEVNLNGDAIDIEGMRELSEKTSSISCINPEVAKEWNYEKNGSLMPDSFTANSNKMVWWKCSQGHEWQSRINNRNKGKGCPYCSGRYAVKGENDLQTVNPALAKEWNQEKNSGLTPADVMINSHKKVWWKCSKDHEWQAEVAQRSRGRGCPYCAGRYVIKGENDLQTVNPNLAKEWNYEKNDGLTPADVMPSSHKKVWWKCCNNHEWQARIADRNRGRGCRFCRTEKL